MCDSRDVTSKGLGRTLPISLYWNRVFSSDPEDFDALHFSVRCLAVKHSFLASSQGPGGFKELRDAGRNRFCLKPWKGFSCSVYGGNELSKMGFIGTFSNVLGSR